MASSLSVPLSSTARRRSRQPNQTGSSGGGLSARGSMTPSARGMTPSARGTPSSPTTTANSSGSGSNLSTGDTGSSSGSGGGNLPTAMSPPSLILGSRCPSELKVLVPFVDPPKTVVLHVEEDPSKRSLDTVLATVVELLDRNGAAALPSSLPYDYYLKGLEMGEDGTLVVPNTTTLTLAKTAQLVEREQKLARQRKEIYEKGSQLREERENEEAILEEQRARELAANTARVKLLEELASKNSSMTQLREARDQQIQLKRELQEQIQRRSCEAYEASRREARMVEKSESQRAQAWLELSQSNRQSKHQSERVPWLGASQRATLQVQADALLLSGSQEVFAQVQKSVTQKYMAYANCRTKATLQDLK